FKFDSLQSEFGQEFLKKNDLSTEEFNSIILVDGNKYFNKSDAALHIGRELKGIYKWSKLLFVFPKFIRDFVYDIISQNRYRWFGKQESCWLPTPDLQEKFLN